MLIQDSTYSNTVKIDQIDPEIMAVNATGFVPVELFNRVESSITEKYEAPMSEPMFGENIKDAIRTVKEWWAPSD